jgi:hypothetical protein
MCLKEKKVSNYPIPSAEINKLNFIENEGYVCITTGTNDVNKFDYCLELIKEKIKEFPDLQSYNPFDFLVSTKTSDRHWFVDDIEKINIYENNNVNEQNSLLLGNKEKFERVYLAILIKN